MPGGESYWKQCYKIIKNPAVFISIKTRVILFIICLYFYGKHWFSDWNDIDCTTHSLDMNLSMPDTKYLNNICANHIPFSLTSFGRFILYTVSLLLLVVPILIWLVFAIEKQQIWDQFKKVFPLWKKTPPALANVWNMLKKCDNGQTGTTVTAGEEDADVENKHGATGCPDRGSLRKRHVKTSGMHESSTDQEVPPDGEHTTKFDKELLKLCEHTLADCKSWISLRTAYVLTSLPVLCLAAPFLGWYIYVLVIYWNTYSITFLSDEIPELLIKFGSKMTFICSLTLRSERHIIYAIFAVLNFTIVLTYLSDVGFGLYYYNKSRNLPFEPFGGDEALEVSCRDVYFLSLLFDLELVPDRSLGSVYSDPLVETGSGSERFDQMQPDLPYLA